MNSNEFAKRRLRSVFLFPLFLVACGSEENTAPDNPTVFANYLADPMALERGRALYVGSCANFCHEVETDDQAVDLFDCTWRHGSSSEELFEIISNGIADTRMVGFGENFPEGYEDTWRLVAYLRSNQSNCEAPAVE